MKNKNRYKQNSWVGFIGGILSLALIGYMIWLIISLLISMANDKKEWKENERLSQLAVDDYNKDIQNDITFSDHNHYIIKDFKRDSWQSSKIFIRHYEGYLVNDLEISQFKTIDILGNTPNNIIISQEISTGTLSLRVNKDNELLYINLI